MAYESQGGTWREMITKETFVKALQLIQEQQEINHQFAKALDLVGDGHYVFGVNNKFYDAAMLVLKEAVNDKYDYISWWLYEGEPDYIAKLYRKESDVLQGYCQSHAASVFFKDRFIGISTPISDWRIIPSGKGNEVVLYHKNTLGDKKTGPVPGYHLQRVSQNTISGYLEYISDHDLYRNMHPLYPVQSKKNSPPPMKGTKRYRKEQKRAAKKARRQSIAHVLTLIENLDTQARVARSM